MLFDSDMPDGVLLKRGADIVPVPVSWLWRGWLARSALHLVAGSPAAGKTTVALSLAATVSRGGLWPDGTRLGRPGNVLIWSGEDAADTTLVPRLIASGADLGRVFFADCVKQGNDLIPFDPAIHIEMIEEVLGGIGGVDLIIIDPLISCVMGDMNANNQVRRSLQPLVDLAARTGAVVIGITHLSKGTAGRDPLERVNGSVAFGALVRAAFMCLELPKDDPGNDGGDRAFFKVKSNLGPADGAFRYGLKLVALPDQPDIEATHAQWGPAENGTARELLARAEASNAVAAAKVLPQDEWLKAFLSTGPKLVKVVEEEAEAAGFSRDRVRRARERLGVTSERNPNLGGYVWTLPAGTFKTDSPGVLGKLGKVGSLAEGGNPLCGTANPARQDDVEVF